jgi:poly-D-alanine transfer protein DltD
MPLRCTTMKAKGKQWVFCDGSESKKAKAEAKAKVQERAKAKASAVGKKTKQRAVKPTKKPKSTKVSGKERLSDLLGERRSVAPQRKPAYTGKWEAYTKKWGDDYYTRRHRVLDIKYDNSGEVSNVEVIEV